MSVPVKLVPKEHWVRQPSLEVCAVECGSKCCTREMSTGISLRNGEERLFPGVPILDEIWVMDKRGIPMRRRVKFVRFSAMGDRCMHLTDEGACAIFDERPVTCRKFPSRPVRGCLVWPT